MKHLLLGLLLATPFATSMATPSDALPFAERQALKRGWLSHPMTLRPSGRAKPDDVGTFDLQQLRIHLSVPERGLPEEARFTVEMQVTAPLVDLVLPLVAIDYEPLQVRLNGVALDFELLADEFLLLVALPAAPAEGEMVVLEIDAGLNIPCEDATGCVNNGPLRHLADFGWYPVSAEFPITDRFNVELIFTGPEEIGVAGTGARAATERVPGGVIRRFATERPTILPAFAMGDFAPAAPFDNRVEVFGPFGLPSGEALGGVAASATSYYEQLLGEYPFSRLGLAPISDDAGVALGPQANILLPSVFWLIPPEDADTWPLVAQTVAHEIGHQYFFNLIGVLDDDEAWMSEAFAEYVATRYWEAISSTRDAARINAWTYLYSVPSRDDEVLNSEAVRSNPYYFEIVYQKGSSVLHMLRFHLGTEAFDAAMRAYVTEFSGQITTTPEFQAVIERVSGVRLEQFFAQWVRRPGFPTLRISAQPARRDGDPVALTVIQESEWGLFEGTAPVVLDLEDGRQLTERLPLSGDFEQPGDGVVRVRVDPELTLLRRVRPALNGDVDLSGVVDGKDLIDVHFAQRRSQPEPSFDDQLDVTNDGRIDGNDERAILEAFGAGW